MTFEHVIYHTKSKEKRYVWLTKAAKEILQVTEGFSWMSVGKNCGGIHDTK